MGDQPEEPPLATLFSQLLADALAVGRAELDVIRQLILYKLAAAQQALLCLAGVLVLAIAAVAVLLIGLALVLAHWLDLAVAALVVAVVALLVAGLVARWAARRLATAVSAKPNEPTA
jgi:hypothetical protein